MEEINAFLQSVPLDSTILGMVWRLVQTKTQGADFYNQMLSYFKSQKPSELSLIKNIQWIYKAMLENELIEWEQTVENAINIFVNYPSGLCSVISHA